MLKVSIKRHSRLVVNSPHVFLLNKIFLRFPVAIAASIATVRYTVSDALVQTSELGNETRWKTWDYSRSSAFALFGLYSGVFYGKIYTKYYAMLMANLSGRGIQKIPAAIGVSLFDSTVVSIVTYYPIYYLIQEYCHTRQFSPINALSTTRDNAIADISAITSFYCPLLVMNLIFVPVHLRAINITIVAIVWSIILSKMRGRYKQDI